jgi:hypothetical protein
VRPVGVVLVLPVPGYHLGLEQGVELLNREQLGSFRILPSAVWSNWKSRPQTWLGRSARSRSDAPLWTDVTLMVNARFLRSFLTGNWGAASGSWIPCRSQAPNPRTAPGGRLKGLRRVPVGRIPSLVLRPPAVNHQVRSRHDHPSGVSSQTATGQRGTGAPASRRGQECRQKTRRQPRHTSLRPVRPTGR